MGLSRIFGSTTGRKSRILGNITGATVKQNDVEHQGKEHWIASQGAKFAYWVAS
jgi:predicted benzoate:H+ symporter BenE